MSKPNPRRRSGARLLQERAGAQPWGGLGPTCGDKRRFASRAEARRSIGSDGDLRPYKCAICGAWHLGHPARRGG